jgi:hypothetical protein
MIWFRSFLLFSCTVVLLDGCTAPCDQYPGPCGSARFGGDLAQQLRQRPSDNRGDRGDSQGAQGAGERKGN